MQLNFYCAENFDGVKEVSASAQRLTYSSVLGFFNTSPLTSFTLVLDQKFSAQYKLSCID